MISFNKNRFLLLLVGIVLCATAGNCSTIFVSSVGDDAADGTSWATAKKTIKAAISAAAAGDEIWVAKGIYPSATTYSADSAIIMKDKVSLYGGFSGTETAREERNPSANVTTLDGSGSLSGVVLFPKNITVETVMDGFTIQNGENSLWHDSLPFGRGGVQCVGCSPTISNNVIAKNSVGIACLQSSPLIINNRIFDNDDSAIDVNASGSISDPNGTLTSPKIANNLIYGNGSSGDGSAIKCYGGITTIVNNTIVGNSGCLDGAIGLQSLYPNYGKAIIANNIIAYNSSGVYADTTLFVTELRNNCVFGNASYNYSGVTDPTGNNGNISKDPSFASRQFAGFHLLARSPCIDSGDSADVLADSKDIDSLERISYCGVDIGADEYDGTTYGSGPNAIIRVSPIGDDSNDGLSWDQPKKTLQSAIDAASAIHGEVWAAKGTYSETTLLRPYAYLYGGFSGNETSRSERNWRQNESIIDALGSGTAVSAFNGFLTSVIDGFTVRGGNTSDIGTARRGGGIVCYGSSIDIANNFITQNNAYDGGGIYLDRSASRVLNNVISKNRAATGGAVFIANTTTSTGALTPLLTNNTIIQNSMTENAAVYLEVPGVNLQNNVFAFNSAGIQSANGQPVLNNNCVYGNYLYNYSGLTDPTGTNGNISADPKVVLDASGIPHIISSSPCIDSGSDTAAAAIAFDINCKPRISSSHTDIGADEFDGTVWGDDTNTLKSSKQIIRVSKTGDDSNDGLTWETAKQTINAALAISDLGAGDELWVAAGIYNERIYIGNNVSLYGGFAGTEEQLSDRPAFPRAASGSNETIIDGQAAGSVVTFAPIPGAKSVLDGFTIRNGKAAYGGGIWCNLASPTISNNTITNNIATNGTQGYGGGISCTNSSALIISNRIANNTAISNYLNGTNDIYGGSGGGVYVSGGSPNITRNTISENATSNTLAGGCFGGGVSCIASAASISGNVISNNAALNSSGWYGKGGGVYTYEAHVVIVNNVIADNRAGVPMANFRGSGGGIYCRGLAYPIISNNTIVSNSASSDVIDPSVSSGGGVKIDSGSLTNNIIAYNSSDIGIGQPSSKNNCIYGNGISNDGVNIYKDPLLIRSEDGIYHLQPDSPCRNAGTATGAPATDIDGQPRPEGSAVDIGADESYGESWDAPVIYVSKNGNDTNDGLSWATAKLTVSAAINASPFITDIWVAKGTYTENLNLINGIALYGGFAGNETSREQRNWIANKTILDGNQAGSVITASKCLATSTRVDGFVITNGKAPTGGGVCSNNSSLTIANNIITHNTALGGTTRYSASGVFFSSWGWPVLVNNIITDNNANTITYSEYGGAICCYDYDYATAIICNNTITHNSVSGNIAHNCAIFGGYYGKIYNNIVAFDSGDIYYYTSTYGNNCLYGNAYGPANSTDPLFVNKEGGDYRLKANSPCINAGYNIISSLPLTDFGGLSRVLGGTVDIGAYEYQPTGDLNSVIGAKRAELNSWVELTDIVTAKFGDAFYVENKDRTSGIRVEKTGHTLDRSKKAHVFGQLKTNANGELYVQASVAEASGTETWFVSPLSLANQWLGGSSLGLQTGISGAAGLNNIGILVQTWGRITESEPVANPTWFKISDGSKASVKCIVPSGVTTDPNCKYVRVTGISSCEKEGDKLIRVLRVRTQSDIINY